MYYIYVIHNQKVGNFYTGYTRDLKLRFEQHNKGVVKSTKGRVPFKLIYYEACLNQQNATKREKYLKTYHGKMFLERRLKSYLTLKMTVGFQKLRKPCGACPSHTTYDFSIKEGAVSEVFPISFGSSK